MNKKMKEDADEFKRKLSMSNSNSSIKPNTNSLRSSQINDPIENNQNWINSQQTARNNPSFSKVPQG
jgi:hypothetical protein